MKNKNLLNKILKENIPVYQWFSDLKKTNTKIKNLKLVSKIKRRSGDFTLITLDGLFLFKNKIYKRAIQYEGLSVVIIPLIKHGLSWKTVVVSQFRAPVGKKTLEFPSGSVKLLSLADQAFLELKEELGIEINKNYLHRLNKDPIYMLPANNYAKSVFFYTLLSADKIKNIEKKKLGVREEGEYIKAKIISIKNLKKIAKTSSVIIGIQQLEKNNII